VASLFLEVIEMDLTEEQWALMAPLVADRPRMRRRKVDGRGRPRVPARNVLNGILWILRTGAPWHDLPDRYPPYQTCHRRFQQWCRDGTFERVLRALAEDLQERGELDLSESFIDGTFVPAKKGGGRWVPPVGVKARKSWRWQTALVFLSPCAQPVLHRMK
jgi:transposase